jgi:hypothetical protein
MSAQGNVLWLEWTVETPLSDIGHTRNVDTDFRSVSDLQPGILVLTDLA